MLPVRILQSRGSCSQEPKLMPPSRRAVSFFSAATSTGLSIPYPDRKSVV